MGRAACEIHAQLMGEVQIEILKSIIWDRFKVNVEFGTGKVVYKETIEDPEAEGWDTLNLCVIMRRYILLLEPGERGRGLHFTDCSEDILDRNWQRLILTIWKKKSIRGSSDRSRRSQI